MMLNSLKSKKGTNNLYLAISIMVGIILAIFLIGIAFFGLAIYFYRQHGRINRQIAQENSRIASLDSEINTLNYTFTQKIDQVSHDVQGELSAAYITRPVPADQLDQTPRLQTVATVAPAGGISGLTPSPTNAPPAAGVSRDSEIQCAFCERFFQSSLPKCPYCGALRVG